MTTAVLTEATADESPQWKARAAGVCWLVTILAGVSSLFTWGRLVVSGNAAATAANIRANPSLYDLGLTADLTGAFAYVGVTVLIYELFKPVSRTLSLMAAAFSLVGCALGGVGCALMFAPRTILSGSPYLTAFTPEQLQSFALLLLRVRAQSNDVALVFFGVHCFLTGYLIWRSAFVPRAVGGLMLVAGLGWLTFLSPQLARSLFPYNMAPGILGEASLTLWLLVKGVDVRAWKERARAALQLRLIPALDP